jgi:hypothetical protein
MKILDTVTQSKKEMLNNGQGQSSNLEENERDILSLMIESERRGEGIMPDVEFKALRCYLLSYTMYSLKKSFSDRVTCAFSFLLLSYDCQYSFFCDLLSNYIQ